MTDIPPNIPQKTGAEVFSLHGHDLPADPPGREYMNTEINNMKRPSAGATDRGRAHVNTHTSRQLISRPRRLGCSCRASLWNRRLKGKRARGVVSVHEGGVRVRVGVLFLCDSGFHSSTSCKRRVHPRPPPQDKINPFASETVTHEAFLKKKKKISYYSRWRKKTS